MIISLIAAVSDNGVIGNKQGLPWHLPPDMRHFKEMTMGKPVVMGRRTFETLKQPLSGRMNIVVTRREDYTRDGCTVVHSPEDAFRAADDAKEVMVAGGATIYRAALPVADRMYLTLIHATFDGDTFFPDYNPAEWEVTERTDFYDSDQPYDYSFVTYERKKK
ncbi:MAG TPA: dihydrofolate reductase [bacterium]|nr:dihydrofolate reductase [bacterium]